MPLTLPISSKTGPRVLAPAAPAAPGGVGAACASLARFGVPLSRLAPAVLASVLSVFLGLAAVVMVMPFLHGLMARAADPAAAGHDPWRWIAAIIAATAAKGAFNVAAHVALSRERRDVVRRVRSATIERVLGFGREYFERHSRTQVLQDVAQAERAPLAILTALHQLAVGALTLAAYVLLMVWASPRLTLSVLLALPLLHLAMRALARGTVSLAAAHADVHSGFFHRVLDALGAWSLVKSSAAEAAEARRIEDASEREMEAQRLYAESAARGHAIREAGVTAVFLLLLLYGVGAGRAHSAADISRLFLFFFAARLALPHVSALAHFHTSAEAAAPHWRRLEELFGASGDAYRVSSGTRPFEGLKRSVCVRQLDFPAEGAERRLRDVSFTAEKGERIALVGSNGAGKTTLARVLMRFYDCAPGRVFFDGVDVREFSIPSLMRRMALVERSPAIFADTLRANLAYGLERKPSDAEIIDALDAAGFRGTFARLAAGLDERIGDGGATLSDGEKKQVMFARVFLKRPDVLVLDEAMSGLDPEAEARVLERIDERLPGAAVIFLAHRPPLGRLHRVLELRRAAGLP